MTCKVEYIDHDADAGIIVQANTLRGLFRCSALAMLDIILDRKKIESKTTRIISIGASSVDLLLVKFLSAILGEAQIEGFGVFDVEIGEMNETAVVAELSGKKGIPPGAIKTEIKLVTYHQLDVHRDEDGKWHARVIFDL